MDFKSLREQTDKYKPYLDRLAAIFRKMDEGYEETAESMDLSVPGVRTVAAEHDFITTP